MIVKYKITTPDNGDDSTDEEPVNEESNEDEAVEMVEEELKALDSHLDRLGSALDNLEKKNDDIHAQLVELLEANRQIKTLFQAGSTSSESDQSETPNVKIFITGSINSLKDALKSQMKTNLVALLKKRSTNGYHTRQRIDMLLKK